MIIDKPKFTKKQRAQAIRILATLAMTPGEPLVREAAASLGIESKRAEELAFIAWWVADDARDVLMQTYNHHETHAEAEALLREGWSPFDETLYRRPDRAWYVLNHTLVRHGIPLRRDP